MGGYAHLAGAGGSQTEREKWMPLMIGSDYQEPCRWTDKTPKLLSYKFSTPIDQALGRGAFDVYFGRGKEDCGSGRLGQFGPRPADKQEEAAWMRKIKNVLN